MEFSNREIATGIWFLTILCIPIINAKTRDSLYSLVRAFFHWKLFSIFLLSYLYITSCVFMMYHLKLWTCENIKTTLFWTIGYTFSSLIKVTENADRTNFFISSVREIFAISGIIIFVVELHSFSLGVEIIAIPLISFLYLCQHFANRNNKDSRVACLFNVILLAISLYYIIYSIYLTYEQFDKLDAILTLREFFVPVILSLLFIPFLYFFSVFATYDSVFRTLQFGIKDQSLLKKAKLRSLIEFKMDSKALKRWSQSVIRFKPRTNEELQRSFIESRMIKKREANPPKISKDKGWSPYAAKYFLKTEGIITRDYTHTLEDEWSASSDYYKLDDSIISNNIAYYFFGTDIAATELKLVLNVNNPKLSSSAESKFVAVCRILLLKSTDEETEKLLTPNIKELEEFQYDTVLETISITRNDWEGGIKGGYSITLTIRSKSHQQIY